MNDNNNVTQENGEKVNNNAFDTPSVEYDFEPIIEIKKSVPPKKKINKKLFIIAIVLLIVVGLIIYLVFGGGFKKIAETINNSVNVNGKCITSFDDKKMFTNIENDVYQINLDNKDVQKGINLCSYYIMRKKDNLVILNKAKYESLKDKLNSDFNDEDIYQAYGYYKNKSIDKLYYIKDKDYFIYVKPDSVNYINQETVNFDSSRIADFDEYGDYAYIKNGTLFVEKDDVIGVEQKIKSYYGTGRRPVEYNDDYPVVYSQVYNLYDFNIENNDKVVKQYFKEYFDNREELYMQDESAEIQRYNLSLNQQINLGSYNLRRDSQGFIFVNNEKITEEDDEADESTEEETYSVDGIWYISDPERILISLRYNEYIKFVIVEGGEIKDLDFLDKSLPDIYKVAGSSLAFFEVVPSSDGSHSVYSGLEVVYNLTSQDLSYKSAKKYELPGQYSKN